MSYSPILVDYTESDGEEVLPPPPSAIPPRKAPPAITELPRIPKKNKKQPVEDQLDETVKAKNERKKKEEERQKEQEKRTMDEMKKKEEIRSAVRQGEEILQERSSTPSSTATRLENNGFCCDILDNFNAAAEKFKREKPRSILTAARWRKVHLESDSFKEGHLITELARMLTKEC
ncbi:hypothetical protein B9Z55_021837 [Caenorhabditis nigoni]|uniref:Uncharacterized protein n=1 Tax=Caenorhabditis nigoni TaxID=1611254 RepID=A0A2G5TU97_9PELO|nr:hypothetical protein B9Z55_021837 [Caenorhabditis nigoni]